MNKLKSLILIFILSLSFVVFSVSEVKAESVSVPTADLIDLGSLIFEYSTSTTDHVVYLSERMLVRNARYIFIENNTRFRLNTTISAFSSPRLVFFNSSNTLVSSVLIEYINWFTVPTSSYRFHLQIVVPIAPGSNVAETNSHYLPLLNNAPYTERVNAFGLSDGILMSADLFQQQYQNGYYKGYDIGLELGKIDGRNTWAYYDNITNNFIDAYTYGDLKFDEGFELASNDDYSFLGLITSVFLGVGELLNITLFYDITLGAILLIPLVFGVITFIVGGRKKDD